MGKEVFISHSSEESELAGEICAELEGHGFTCWIAPQDVEPGAEYAAQINAAIRNARVFLLVLSTKSSQSKHVRRELEIADRNGVFLLPVRVESRKSFGDEIDYFVSNKQWFDALSRPLGRSLDALIQKLREQLGDPRLNEPGRSSAAAGRIDTGSHGRARSSALTGGGRPRRYLVEIPLTY